MDFEELERRITETLEKPPLHRERVIRACGRLSELIMAGAYEEQICGMGFQEVLTEERLFKAAYLLSETVLKRKVETEFAAFEGKLVMPLGVLFHVTAGNMEGIPAYSVLEGLLAGNINLLKLPSNDDGISTFLLRELIRLDGELADYIYTFRIPSADERRLKKLLSLSDGVCTWGTEAAVAGIRRLAPVGAKLIEWGHRISFSVVTETGGKNKEALYALAREMIRTDQLLCSSCQGIYVEMEQNAAYRFCRDFLTLLERARREYGKKEIGFRGRNTVSVYDRQLESAFTGDTVFRGDGVSVIFSQQPKLELSMMFGNCWVKPVERSNLVKVLRKSRGMLQTAGLICKEEEIPEFTALLSRAGVNRIVFGGPLSSPDGISPHDGQYPLICYSRIVELQ